MSRPLTLAAKESIFAEETDVVWLVLLTIEHADLDAPIRVVRNTEDVISRTNTFLAFPFDISMPQEREDSPPEVQLIIGNVDRRITEAVRTISSPAQVTMEVVHSGDFDTVEAGPFVFELKEARFDALVVTGKLAFEPVLDESYPKTRFTPGRFPGLF